MDEEDLLVPLREESADVYAKDFEETKKEKNSTKIPAKVDEPTPEAAAEKSTLEEEPRRITPIILKAVNDGGDKNKNSSYIVKSPNPNHTETVMKQVKRKGRPPKRANKKRIYKYGKRGRPSREAIERVRLLELQKWNEVKGVEEVKIKTEVASQFIDNSGELEAEQLGESREGLYSTVVHQLKLEEQIDTDMIENDFMENTDNSPRDRLRKCPQRLAQDYVYARKTRGRPKLKTFCSVKEFCDFNETKPSYIEDGINPKPPIEDDIESIKPKRGRPRIHPPKEKSAKRGRGKAGGKPFKITREPQYDENGELIKPRRGRPSTNPFKVKYEPRYDENGLLEKPRRGRPRTKPFKVKREPQYDENGVLVKRRPGRPSNNPFKVKNEPRYDENGVLIKPRRGRPIVNPLKMKHEPEYDENGVLVKRRAGRQSTNPFKVNHEPRYDESGLLLKSARGRPSTNPYKIKFEPQYDENGMIVKGARGRPRVHPKKNPDVPKRGRGRPPKYRMGRDLEGDGDDNSQEAPDDDLCDSSILEPQVNIIEGISSFPNNNGMKMNGSGYERNRSILDAMNLRKVDRLPCATMESFITASLNATSNSALNMISKTGIQVVNDEPVSIADSDDSDNEENGAVEAMNDSVSESHSFMGESTAERTSTDLESFSVLTEEGIQVTVVIDADNGDIIATKPRTNILQMHNETVSTQTDQVREDCLTPQNGCSLGRQTNDDADGDVTIIENSPVKPTLTSSIAIQVVPEIYEILDDDDSRSSKNDENETVEIEEDSSDGEEDGVDVDDDEEDENDTEA